MRHLSSLLSITTTAIVLAIGAFGASPAGAASATPPMVRAPLAQSVQYFAPADAEERAEWQRRREWRRQRDEARIAEAARQEAARIEAEREQRRARRWGRRYEPQQPYLGAAATEYDRK